MKCPNCNHELNNNVCPHCGQEFKEKNNNKVIAFVVIGCIAVFIALFVIISIISGVIVGDTMDNAQNKAQCSSEGGYWDNGACQFN